MFDVAQQNLFFRIAREKQERLRAAWAKLDSPQAVTEFQGHVRERFWQVLGGRGEPCGLEAATTGVIRCDGYRIEKVHFQSLPRFIVTANLYVPDGVHGKVPGVLVAMGHHPPAKAWPEYQILCANLALHGAVVLGFDPLGQGERGPFYSYHYGDAKGNAHDAQGYQCQLTGRPLAFYFLWDAFRALDYLASRPEVDATRLGCTGSSGGGMQATHLAAVDERVNVVAPICNTGAHFDVFATWMLHPEGNLADMFDEIGACNENLAICAAPRRQLLIGGSEDQLPLTGMRGLFDLLQRIYAVLGVPGHVGFRGIIENHGCTPPMREAVCEAMRVGLNLDGSPNRPDVATRVLTAEELRVTKSGHVEELGSLNVHQLNLARAQSLAAARQGGSRGSDADAAAALQFGLIATHGVSSRSNVECAEGLRLENVGDGPVVVEDGAQLTQAHLMPPTGREPLLTLGIYRPTTAPIGTMIFIRDTSYAHFGRLIRNGLSHQQAVVTAELPYVDSQRLLMLGLTPAGFYGLLLGKILRDLLERAGGDTQSVRLVVQGRLSQLLGCILAQRLRDRLAAVAFVGGYFSFVDSLRGPRQAYPELQVTMGFLEHADFPEIVKSLVPTRVIMANPLGGDDKVVPPEKLEAAVEPLRRGAKVEAYAWPEAELYERLATALFDG